MAAPLFAKEESSGKIAFVANLEGNWDLFMMNADGNNLVRLTQTPLDERAPDFSPDGKRIVYSTSDGTLWIMALENREASRLPVPAGRYNHPAWSADGAEIVYTAYTFSDHGEDADLWVYSFKEKKSKEYITQPGVQDYPAYSPTGDRLVYSSSGTITVAGSGFTVIQQLWVVTLADGKIRQLGLGSAKDTEPAWSPDGKSVAFSSDREGNPDLWIAMLDGKEPTRLTTTAAAESHPAWSPGGGEIAYIAAESGIMTLRVIDINERKSRDLNPFGEKKVDIRDPDWR